MGIFPIWAFGDCSYENYISSQSVKEELPDRAKTNPLNSVFMAGLARNNWRQTLCLRARLALHAVSNPSACSFHSRA